MDESLSKNGSTRSTTSIARLSWIMQLCIIVTRLFWPRYVEMKFTVAGSERQRVTRRSLHQIYSSLGRRGGKGWTSHPKINPVNNRRDRAPFAPEILNQGEGNGDHGYTRSLGKARYRCLESKWMLSFDLNELSQVGWNREIFGEKDCWKYCGDLLSFEENLDTFIGLRKLRKDFNIMI